MAKKYYTYVKRMIFINVFWTVLQLVRSISSLNALIFLETINADKL